LNITYKQSQKQEKKKPKESNFDNLHLLKHLLKLHLINPVNQIPKQNSIIYKVYLDKKMKNKFKKEEWENNIIFYKKLFGATSFKEYHELVGEVKGTVEHFDGAKKGLKRGEYNLRKTSGDQLKPRNIDLKEYSDINTIKRNIVKKPQNKIKDFEAGEAEGQIYESMDFNKSEKSDMFDTNSSIDATGEETVLTSLETSKENDNIRQIIEQCIMEGEAKIKESMPLSMESIEENEMDNSNYSDPFGKSKNRRSSIDFDATEDNEKPTVKTSFVKFRDVKYIESYDFDTVESNIVWNPLKESKAPDIKTNVKKSAFSLQNTCFEKIENKLIYAMTEAFRSNAKDIVDTELLELIQGIYQNPGNQEVVIKFFKKGKNELETSKKYLWKFHVVCKNFLSLEQEGLFRRLKRFIKGLEDFALRQFIKDFEITVIKKQENAEANLEEQPSDSSEVSMTSKSGNTLYSKVTSTTRIETPLFSTSYHSKKSLKSGSGKRNTFYLVRKSSKNSRIRKHPMSYSMPSIYVQPLILKAFRSAISDPKKNFQMISALNVNDYYSPKDFKEVPSYSQNDVFAELKNKKYVIFSVQNLLEMFEMIFDKQKEMFEMKVKTNMIEYFLKKRFELVKNQMMSTFKEMHLTSYFKDLQALNNNSEFG
jgi:hypothetical protein